MLSKSEEDVVVGVYLLNKLLAIGEGSTEAKAQKKAAAKALQKKDQIF
jgi:dsRNA-specific ribonuclease